MISLPTQIFASYVKGDLETRMEIIEAYEKAGYKIVSESEILAEKINGLDCRRLLSVIEFYLKPNSSTDKK